MSSLTLRTTGKAPATISATSSFIPGASQQLCNFTGGTPNNFSVDSPIDGTRYAPAELYFKVLSGTAAITYSFYNAPLPAVAPSR